MSDLEHINYPVRQLLIRWEHYGFSDGAPQWYRVVVWRRRFTGTIEPLEDFLEAEFNGLF